MNTFFNYISVSKVKNQHLFCFLKRDNKEGQSQLLRRQEEMRRVREEIERQQEQIAPVQGKPLQEKG